MISSRTLPKDRPAFAPPDGEDLLELASNLRSADRAELYIATLGLSAIRAIELAVRSSDHTLAARLDGRLVAVFGIRADSLLDRTAIVWALGTREIDRLPRPFIRWSPRALRVLSSALPWADRLTNSVWSLNTPARRWLAWLGAGFGTPYAAAPVPPFQSAETTFIPFTIERSELCAHP